MFSVTFYDSIFFKFCFTINYCFSHTEKRKKCLMYARIFFKNIIKIVYCLNNTHYVVKFEETRIIEFLLFMEFKLVF